MDGQPRLIVIGGANGSGKTTLAREYISVENLPYLGADQIAFELNPANVESVAIEAGRLFIKHISDRIERKGSFIVESTLSGMSLRKWVRRAQDANYTVKTAFVYLDDASLCIERVAARVARGGHHVPAEDIERRYHRSNRNFWEHYKNDSSAWELYNNTGDALVLVASGDDCDTIVSDTARFDIWLKMVN